MAEKQTEAVKAALQAVDAQKERISAQQKLMMEAQAELHQMQTHLYELQQALKMARVKDDEALPQCRLVMRQRYSGHEKGAETMVIVRQTPSGQIVIRPIGSVEEHSRWKLEKWGVWHPVKSERGYSSMTRELVDVPAEFVERAKAGAA